MLIARVLPDVSGLDQAFDYLVPEPLDGAVEVGTRVRVDLHGRKVGGWILALGDDTGAPSSADPARSRS